MRTCARAMWLHNISSKASWHTLTMQRRGHDRSDGTAHRQCNLITRQLFFHGHQLYSASIINLLGDAILSQALQQLFSAYPRSRDSAEVKFAMRLKLQLHC